MDEALQLVIEMSELIWNHFKDGLKDVTPEEINWRTLPQANTINTILRHLRIEARWHLASLERRLATWLVQLNCLGGMLETKKRYRGKYEPISK